jgi:acyl-CoA thioesterase FadM
LDDRLLIETWISKLSPITVTFSQIVKNAQTGVVYIQAEFETVAINNEGKLYRRMPAVLKEVFERALVCKD